MSAPELSVVIPSHNYGRYLPHAVESVLSQEPDAEVVVVDDASSDSTGRVLEDLAGSVTPIRLRENVGPGAAWRIGLEAAKGGFVCVKLDADDWYLPGGLTRLLGPLRAHPRVGWVVGSAIVKLDDQPWGHLRRVVRSDQHVNADRARSMLVEGFRIKMPAVCARREAIPGDLNGLEALKVGHDWDFMLRGATGEHEWMFRPAPVAVIRIHPSSVTRSIGKDTRLRSDLRTLVDAVAMPGYPTQLTGKERARLAVSAAQVYLRVARSGRLSGALVRDRLRFAHQLVREGGGSVPQFAVAMFEDLARYLVRGVTERFSRIEVP